MIRYISVCMYGTIHKKTEHFTPLLHMYVHTYEYRSVLIPRVSRTMSLVECIHKTGKQIIRVKKTRGAATPHTRNTWVSFLGSEEPSLKLLRSPKLQRTNSSPISNCRRSKLAIFFSCNRNYSINSLLRLCVGTRIIYI